MSRPDFDGVYRTRPAEGVFTGKKRPEIHLPITSPLPPHKASKKRPQGVYLPNLPCNPPRRGGITGKG